MKKTVIQDDHWDLILCPKRKILDIPIKEIIEYKDLIYLFIRRDFVIKYKQTVLGPIWYFISPLISAIIYSFVFGKLAGLQTNGVPHLLFYYAGTMLWAFFSQCFSDATNIFVNNSDLFGKVYFPRLVVPISNAAGSFMKMFMQLLCLAGFYIYYVSIGIPIRPTWLLALFPLIVLQLSLLANGVGMIISSITTKYRDLRILVEFAFGLSMYATAVIYPISQIPENYSWLSYINPVNAPLELSRLAFFGTGSLNMLTILSSVGQTLFFLLLGLVMFNQNERHFIDVV